MSGAARMLARREPAESARAYPVGEGAKSREEEDVAAVATKLADATNMMPPSWEGAANAFGTDHVHKASPHVERRAKLGTIPMPKVPAVPDQESPALTPTSQGPWAPFITIDPSAPPELVAQVSAAEAAIVEAQKNHSGRSTEGSIPTASARLIAFLEDQLREERKRSLELEKKLSETAEQASRSAVQAATATAQLAAKDQVINALEREVARWAAAASK